MSEHHDEELQKLLRLKNFETPGDLYFEDFLVRARVRREHEAKALSPFSLWKERAADWFEDHGHAKWAVPAGSLASLAALFFALGGTTQERQISENKPPLEEKDKNEDSKPVFELKLPTPSVEAHQSGVVPAGFEGKPSPPR